MRRRILALASFILCALLPVWAQEQKPQDDMPGVSNTLPDSPAASPDAPKPEPSKPEPSKPEISKPEAKAPEVRMNDADMRDMAGVKNEGTAHAKAPQRSEK